MDSRIVARIVREIKVALTKRDRRSISNVYNCKHDVVYIDALGQLNFEFSFRSYLYPSWMKKEFFEFPDKIRRNISRYLCDLFQSIMSTDNSLSQYRIQNISVRPSRNLEVMWWDGDDVLQRNGNILRACLPIYLPFYCIPKICSDTLLGRKYTFHICVKSHGPVP
jgi:hypothetical protein